MPGRTVTAQPPTSSRTANGVGGILEKFKSTKVRARGRFRVGEMKIFPGYSFPNEKDRRSTTFDPR
jgi:hypothetical protein